MTKHLFGHWSFGGLARSNHLPYIHCLPTGFRDGACSRGESMPHTKSAKKNLRKTEKRRLHNRAEKKAIRTHCKRVAEAAGAGNAEAAKKELVLAIRKLDKAAAKRVIHPNLAARKNSQLVRLINPNLAAKPAEPSKPTT